MEEKEYKTKFWRKAIKGAVGGRTLNKRGDAEEFLLKGDPTNPKANFDDMTLEIKDLEAEKFFKKSNKPAIVKGYLIEISDHEVILDETNAVTDGELRDMLKKPLSKMRIKVDKFTSPVPVIRLLDIAEEGNKPIRTIEYLRAVVVKLEGPATNIRTAKIDDVQVGSTS